MTKNCWNFLEILTVLNRRQKQKREQNAKKKKRQDNGSGSNKTPDKSSAKKRTVLCHFDCTKINTQLKNEFVYTSCAPNSEFVHNRRRSSKHSVNDSHENRHKKPGLYR